MIPIFRESYFPHFSKDLLLSIHFFCQACVYYCCATWQSWADFFPLRHFSGLPLSLGVFNSRVLSYYVISVLWFSSETIFQHFSYFLLIWSGFSPVSLCSKIVSKLWKYAKKNDNVFFPESSQPTNHSCHLSCFLHKWLETCLRPLLEIHPEELWRPWVFSRGWVFRLFIGHCIYTLLWWTSLGCSSLGTL